MSNIEKDVSRAISLLFPDGNYYMYWLYISFILVFPILLYSFTIMLMLLNYGTTISTESFVAEMRFRTSYACSGIIVDFISVLLIWCSHLWIALSVHTIASVGFDAYYIHNRRGDL